MTTGAAGSTLAIPASGLSGAAAASRLGAEGANELPAGRRRGWAGHLLDAVREPMLGLLVAAGVINVAIAEPLDGTLLFACVVVVVGISVLQGRRSERALDALRDLTSPRALVVRDGVAVRIPGREVVRGDCVLLREGDRIPADAVLVDAVNLEVDESTLTGESVPVRKVTGVDPGPDPAPPGAARPEAGPTSRLGDRSSVFLGTLVVRGRGVARVTATGRATEVGRLGQALRSAGPERTPLQREVARLVRVIAVVGVTAAVLVAVLYTWERGDWLEGALAGIATAMSMLPEEFPVVLAVFLALGAWRLSRRRVLARRSAVVETLGSATVVCVDKTGTITQNRMAVRDLVVDGRHFAPGDRLDDAVHELVEYAVLAAPADPFDPMDRAFRDLAARALHGTEHLHDARTLVREYPLADDLLAFSHVWRLPDATELVVATKGAAEAVVDLCHLGAGERAAVLAEADRLTRAGRRVLGVARTCVPDGRPLPEGQHDFACTFLGLVGLDDPVRPGVAEAVAECARAGIRTVMITGDAPGTARAVAAEIGLPADGDCLTGAEVDALDDADLAARLRSVSVVARAAPVQKLRLVRALQADGEVVAMTGDGVNDAPALRAADVGVAMGARGTDVAREAAALVVTDDDFTSIVGGVRLGRGIADNLRKAMTFLLAVHVLIVGMALVPLLDPGWPLVLLPVQIAFLELIIDPACSVVFEAEPVDPQIMGRAPRPPRAPLLDRSVVTVALVQGAVMLLVVVAVYLHAVMVDRPAGEVRSATFLALVLGNLGLILANRSWRLSIPAALRERRNPALLGIVAFALVALVVVLGVPAVREAFRFGPLVPADLVIAPAAVAVGLAWFELRKRFRARNGPAGRTPSDRSVGGDQGR